MKFNYEFIVGNICYSFFVLFKILFDWVEFLKLVDDFFEYYVFVVGYCVVGVVVFGNYVKVDVDIGVV